MWTADSVVVTSSCFRILNTFAVLFNKNTNSVSVKYILETRSEGILLGQGAKFRMNTVQIATNFREKFIPEFRFYTRP
jgi:hypothetical protein